MALKDTQKKSTAPIGILLTNTGTPKAPTPKAVRRFLAEFLADRRIVRLPRWFWLPILHLIILNTRPRRSAQLYQRIWNEHGSPLLHISQSQASGLRQALAKRFNFPIQIQVGMRYGAPSLASALDALRSAGVERLVVLPLFPQYSQTTSASAIDAVQITLSNLDWSPELRLIESYFDHPAYISALVKSIERYWQKHGKPERLLFSYHGIPQGYSLDGDPYSSQCQASSSLVAEALGLEKVVWQLSFQSRFGPGEWLQPYTLNTLQGWGASGINNVQIIAPGFASDCLETLSELAIEAKESFISAGGKKFGYIPALNTQPEHINALVEIIQAELQDWDQETPAIFDHKYQEEKVYAPA
ncbi:ferrochelatase [Chloroflexota bacterium]